MCCSRLAANRPTGRKKVAKNRHLGTIPQLYRAISLQLRHVSRIGKKLIKQQYLPYMSPQYGELRPTSGWDHSLVWGTPSNFNGVRVLVALLHGTLVVGVSQTAALNRGRHLYSAGRPSLWALAHISSLNSTARGRGGPSGSADILYDASTHYSCTCLGEDFLYGTSF